MAEPICSTSYGRSTRLCADEGATLDETKREQRTDHNLLHAAGHVGLAVGIEVTTQGAEHGAEALAKLAGRHALAVGAEVLGTAATAVTATLHAFEFAVDAPARAGEELSAASVRDAANAGLALVIQHEGDVLPSGFADGVQHRGTPKGATFSSKAFQAAGQVLHDAAAGDLWARAFCAQARASAREGLAVAYQRHLDGEHALAEARTSPEFEKRWNEDPAFRLGVQGAIWQATFDAAAFDQATALNAQLRAQVRP